MVDALDVKFPTAAVVAAGEAVAQTAEQQARAVVGRVAASFLLFFKETRFRTYDRQRGNKVASRSGTLRGNFGATVMADGSVSVHSNGALYAAAQEFGGTIKPTKRKFLTIPLDGALTPAGVTRNAARLVKVGSSWQTKGLVPGAASKDTFIRRSKKSGAPVVMVEGAGGHPIALYVLKKSVKLRPLLGFFQAVNDHAPQREAAFERALERTGIAFSHAIEAKGGR